MTAVRTVPGNGARQGEGAKPLRVLGFDPGYAITGWGLVEVRPVLRSLRYGAIVTDAGLPIQNRLRSIQLQAVELLNEAKPTHIVVEQLYLGKNRTTAEGVYEARGVLLAAVAECGAELIEISPGTIKRAVTGNGSATKRDVTLMVRRILDIREEIRPDDTADALAGALAGAFLLQSGPMYAAMRQEKEKRGV